MSPDGSRLVFTARKGRGTESPLGPQPVGIRGAPARRHRRGRAAVLVARRAVHRVLRRSRPEEDRRQRRAGLPTGRGQRKPGRNVETATASSCTRPTLGDPYTGFRPPAALRPSRPSTARRTRRIAIPGSCRTDALPLSRAPRRCRGGPEPGDPGRLARYQGFEGRLSVASNAIYASGIPVARSRGGPRRPAVRRRAPRRRGRAGRRRAGRSHGRALQPGSVLGVDHRGCSSTRPGKGTTTSVLRWVDREGRTLEQRRRAGGVFQRGQRRDLTGRQEGNGVHRGRAHGESQTSG